MTSLKKHMTFKRQLLDGKRDITLRAFIEITTANDEGMSKMEKASNLVQREAMLIRENLIPSMFIKKGSVGSISSNRKESNQDLFVLTPPVEEEPDRKEDYGYTEEGRRSSRLGKRIPPKSLSRNRFRKALSVKLSASNFTFGTG